MFSTEGQYAKQLNNQPATALTKTSSAHKL
jgi:hypothetical protein